MECRSEDEFMNMGWKAGTLQGYLKSEEGGGRMGRWGPESREEMGQVCRMTWTMTSRYWGKALTCFLLLPTCVV